MSTHDDTCTALGIGIIANVPTLLWGNPGQGKTSVIKAIADRYALHLETIIAAIYEPSDFAGLPVVDPVTRTTALASPAWATRLADREEGLVFYDEVSTAPPAVQAALLRPILEGVVGETVLPAGVRTVAAANPADIAAGGWDLAAPMANRFLHLDWNLPASVVRDGFAIGWPVVDLPTPDPERVESLFAESKILVGTFIGARPELATKMPDSSADASRAFPTPRSWEQVAKLYAFAQAADVNETVINLLLQGSVGTVAAGEFLTFVANLDLPDPEALLADPASFVAPLDRPDKMYAICASVYSAMAGNITVERWQATGEILGEVARAGSADIAFIYGQRWTQVRPPNAMPSRETALALAPVLQALGRFE